MRRRALVATVASTGLAAITGCLDGDSDENGGGNGSENDAPEDDEPDGTDGEPSPPFEVATIDAPGSEAGTVAVPQSDQPLLVNFTRTQCPTSRGLLPTIAEAKTRLEDAGYAVDGDDPDIRFLSVTDGTRGPSPTAGELADWWRENGGDWLIGVDETGALNDYYEIAGFPTTIAIDGSGEIHWRHRSDASPDAVVSGAETAIEAGAETADQRAP